MLAAVVAAAVYPEAVAAPSVRYATVADLHGALIKEAPCRDSLFPAAVTGRRHQDPGNRPMIEQTCRIASSPQPGPMPKPGNKHGKT